MNDEKVAVKPESGRLNARSVLFHPLSFILHPFFPALLALLLALLFRDPFIGDWDAIDYTMLAVNGQPSPMALGRLLFIGYNHALWWAAHSLFNLKAEHAYLLFQFAVIAQAPLAALACWKLARAVSGSRQVATLAAVLVVTSPAFIVYSGQVMTEIPSLLLATGALLIYLRGLQTGRLGVMLAGAALLGLGVNLRETVAFYGVWLLLAPLAQYEEEKRRRGEKVKRSAPSDSLPTPSPLHPITLSPLLLFIFLLCALGPFALWFGLDVGNYRLSWYGWLESLRMESARHPVTWRNLWPFGVLSAFTAPLIFALWPFALRAEWRRQRFSVMFALGLTGLLVTLLLVFNYSTTINARYFLTGLPALAPLVAAFLWRGLTARLGDERRAFVWALAIVCAVAALRLGVVVYQQSYQRAGRLGTRDYLSQLQQLPPDAIVMAGAQTVAVTYWSGIGASRWEIIGTGGGWPGANLLPLIQQHLADGRRVFLDTDPRRWAVCGWQSAETRALPELERHFRFRRVNATLYELRPMSDATAQDAPGLATLQPEQRPADVRKCFSVGK